MTPAERHHEDVQLARYARLSTAAAGIEDERARLAALFDERDALIREALRHDDPLGEVAESAGLSVRQVRGIESGRRCGRQLDQG